MAFDRLLHLLRKHLLAGRINADAAAPQQRDRTVGFDGGEVAGKAITHTIDFAEGGGAFFRILVVAHRHAAAGGDHAHFPRARLHFPTVLGKDLHAFVEDELGGFRGGFAAGDAGAHAAFGGAHGVNQHHVVVLEQALLVLGAPHHAAGDDLADAGNVVGVAAPRRFVKRGQQGPGKGVADDDEIGDAVAFHQPPDVVRVEPQPRREHHGAA